MPVKPGMLVAAIAVSLLALVTLGGCMSFDGVMTLYKSGQWESTFDLIVSRRAVVLVGGEAAMDASIAEQLGPSGGKQEQGGATYSWKKVESDSNSIVYRVRVSGNDLQSLNTAMGGGASAQLVAGPDGTEWIHFTFRPSALGSFDKARFSLTAGKILNSNAVRVSGGTAEWDDLTGYKLAEATVSGAHRGPTGALPLTLVGGLGIIAAAGVGVWIAGRRRSRVQYSRPGLCTSCGGALLRGASFCMRCGTRVDTAETHGGE